jgi:hypothetical protein
MIPTCRRISQSQMLLVVRLGLLVLLPLLASPIARGRPMLGPRDLSQLSSSQISSLIHTQDPVKNIDPANPRSHLSKILIPRPRKSLKFFLSYSLLSRLKLTPQTILSFKPIFPPPCVPLSGTWKKILSKRILPLA